MPAIAMLALIWHTLAYKSGNTQCKSFTYDMRYNDIQYLDILIVLLTFMLVGILESLCPLSCGVVTLLFPDSISKMASQIKFKFCMWM